MRVVIFNNVLSQLETLEDMTAISKSFGDGQSTLLDQYERLSFELHLNQAMLPRSLSGSIPASGQAPVRRGLRNPASGFHAVIKRMFRPILDLGKRGAKTDAAATDPKYPAQHTSCFCNSFGD